MVQKTGRAGYLQIADDLRSKIKTGELAPGAALPSTAQLCSRYEVSASVVKAAISVLRTEGYIVGQQGKGVFVTDKPIEPEQPEGGQSEIIEQLSQMRGALRDLGDRIADLEQAVFPERKQSR
ncbi:GntR family transcriptional regulator [Acrocarpospora catenulata]|uniref:GntR family transcriptional regulator n=1 Tax=Acrocarpospora catenulata TaxID=2836182 RepID=UPI001BDAB7F1|nr:winged helix-turn-helix domain-containing protein [Acrocarpospora catenulata]